MKIIGGPHDGLDVMIGADRRHINLWHTIKPAPTWSISPRGEVTPSPVGPTITWEIYTVRRMWFGDDIEPKFIEVLMPADWTDRQGFTHMMERHR